ncbi:hypothetical protein ACQPW1_11565 [Nocardia sp. CA-128927]|uniref:hypothetical protein n=1 Tax=Nocardia sp. CA-128927 TaxID=3239975 RepID=UPI003D9621FB
MPGARKRRADRIAAVIPLVKNLQTHSRECDSVWWARRTDRQDWFWLTTPFSVNARGDTAIQESNYEVAQQYIAALSPFGTDYRIDLWPGGRIHTLTVRADDAAALRELDRIITALQDCPILDEQDVSAREWDHNHPDGGERECYAESCCTCVYRTHRHHVEVTAGGSAYPECAVCGTDVEDWNPGRYDPTDPRPDRQPTGPRS